MKCKEDPGPLFHRLEGPRRTGVKGARRAAQEGILKQKFYSIIAAGRGRGRGGRTTNVERPRMVHFREEKESGSGGRGSERARAMVKVRNAA